MKVVYLAHPLSAPTHKGIQENLARAKRWYRWACDTFPEYAFVANWILNCEVYDDANAEHRRKGIERNLAVIEKCDELWLVGARISSGMEEEGMHMTYKVGKRVLDWTHLTGDPSNAPEHPRNWRRLR
jgi:hypothetical protein